MGRSQKEAGNTAKASAVFKKIYIGAGEFSNSALAELKAEDIKTGDILERASNLFKRYNFAEAERDLRQALVKDDGTYRAEIFKNLGHSLFKQKKYREASEVFGRVGEFYYKARSLYRAGDKKEFEATLSELIARDDKRAGYLLNAVAADKRREKDFVGAIKIYNDVLKNYPSDAEEALWGIGWSQYLSADYSKAAVTFSQLYTKYDDLKYLYWKARSLEADGKNPAELYGKIMPSANNFYAAMTYALHKKPPGRAVSPVPSLIDGSRTKIKISERVEAMLSLDMRKEAVIELASASRKIDTPSELVYIMSKFQDSGNINARSALHVSFPILKRCMHSGIHSPSGTMWNL